MVCTLGGTMRLSIKLSRKAACPMTSRVGGRVRLRSCLLSKAWSWISMTDSPSIRSGM